MKKLLYPRLAWTGIRKNKRLYAPYLLTCAGMVMMHYIITALSCSNAVHSLRGGSTITAMLSMGSWIIALFSLIFLFYTNSFLIRRRMKEFGLYNILGMGKGNIARILVWETLISAALTLLTGLFGGFSPAFSLRSRAMASVLPMRISPASRISAKIAQNTGTVVSTACIDSSTR